MNEPECPKCKGKQWSIIDRNYLELFDHCWSCNEKDWEDHKLSTEEFERRERLSLERLST